MNTGSSAQTSTSPPNRMHLQSARDGILSKRKKRGQTVEAVSVHVMKLEDLPEPLTRREFREICQREGIPVCAGGNGIGKPTSGDFFDQCRDSQTLRVQERWNNTVSNLFGAYLKVFDLFKSWHSSMIQQRHIGPQNVEEHVASQLPRPPFKNPIKPNLSKTESQHIMKQRTLVNLLIQYGIGLGMSEAIQDIGGGADQKLHSGQQTMRYPSPMGSHQYGPTVNQRMIFEQLAGQSHQTFKQSDQNLQLPAAMKRDQVRRQSFGSENDSRNLHSHYDSSNGKPYKDSFEITDGRGDDFEHFDIQDEVQIAQNAAERLRLITAKPESILDRSVERAQKTHANLKKDSSMMKFGEDLLSGPTLTEKELNNDKEFFSPMHLRLKQELLETREKLEYLQKQLESSEKRNVAVISKYNKEEVDRAVLAKHLSMPYPEQADALKSQIESKLFDVTDGLEPHIVDILNQKLDSIKSYFIGQIQLISHHTESLRQNVALMENMNKDGIKFSEMETDKLIERMYWVEDLKRNQNAELRQLDPTSKHKKEMNRPQCIWNMLTKHFGQDYFLEVIEEEFGITPGANEIYASKIEHHFQHSITAYKVQQHRMQREFEDQVKMLREEIQDLTESNSRLMKQNEKQRDNKMQELRKNLTAIAENNEKNLDKKYLKELKHRDETIKELNHERDNFYRSQKSMQLNWAFKRMQMFRTVSNLIKNLDEHKRTKIDYKVLKLIERFMIEEQLLRRYSDEHDVPPQVVKHEMYQNKLLKWKRKFEESEANFGWHSNKAEFNAARIEEYRCEVERLKEQNVTQKLQLPQLKMQVQQFSETIRLKELTIKELTENVIAIEKRWANQTKDPHKFTAKKILESLQVKSDNELSTFLAVTALKNVTRGHKNRTVGTITTHQNVSVPFESKRMAEKAEVDEKEVQVGAQVVVDGTQTEFLGIDASCGKDRDFRLKSKQVQCDDATGKQNSESKGLMRQSTFADLNGPNSSNQAATASNRMTKTGKTSFSKPQMKKAQSTVLGSKEFLFNNTSRGQNMSSLSKDIMRGDDNRSQSNNQDSAQKLMRRNTIVTKTSAQKRAHAGSQIDHSKDSKAAFRRQTTVMVKQNRSDNLRSDAGSPDDSKSKRSRVLRGQTVESITHNSKDKARQTGAGASTHSVNSVDNFANMHGSQTLRQAQPKLNSPLNAGHQSAMTNAYVNTSTLMKSPDKLNISNPKNAQKNLQKSKEKLGTLSKKQKDVTHRLTSAVVKQSTDKQIGGNNLRNTLGKHQSKRELKNPSMLKTEHQMSQSKLGKSSKQNSITATRKNNQRILSDFKDDPNKTTLTRQSIGTQGGGLATVRSNTSSQQQSVNKIRSRAYLPKKGIAGTSGMSPTSYMIVSGGEEVPAGYQTGEYSSNRIKGYPAVQVNSFGELVGNMTSPLQNTGKDFTPGQLPRERNTDQMPTENSAINLNLMEARFNPGQPNATEYDDNGEFLVQERNLAMKLHRPTTVQDNSKDYSPTESRGQQIMSASASEHFSHLQKKSIVGGQSDEEQDIYSTQSVRAEQLVEMQDGRIHGSQRRVKNLSNQFDELHADGTISNEGAHQRGSPNKQSTLFFGGEGKKQLTQVQEEHQRANKVGSNNQSLVEFTQNAVDQAHQPNTHLTLSGGPLSMSSRKNSANPRNERSHRSSSRSSRKRKPSNMSAEAQRNAQRLSIQKYKSFATDDDSSAYNSHEKEDPPLDRICHMIEKQNNMKDPSASKQSRIQKLLLKGYINEEQFICLQLLEKGYIPSSPGDFMQAQQAATEARRNEQKVHAQPSHNSSNHRRNVINRFQSATSTIDGHHKLQKQHHGANTISVNTASSGFYKRHGKRMYSSSNSRSPSRSHKRGVSRGFFEKTYRIYPKKIPELEKIYNRVYSKKREIGTQCDEETTADALMRGQEQEEINRMIWMNQTGRVGNNPPKSSMNQARKKISSGSQPKTARHFHSRRNSKDLKTQANSATQYPFSTMHSIGERTSQMEMVMGQQAFPQIQSQPTLNTLQKSAEVFHEKNSARSKWVNAIPVEKSEPNQQRKGQKVHKLTKNHRDQVRIMQMQGVNQQRANIMTSCSQRSGVKPMMVAPQADMVSGYKTNQGKAPHNLIVPAGHGAFVAHAINGRQTAPPKRSDHQQQQIQGHHYLAQHVPKS